MRSVYTVIAITLNFFFFLQYSVGEREEYTKDREEADIAGEVHVLLT